MPDAFVRRAEQVELIDMSPDALRRRLAHGNVFPPGRVDAALANAFRPANLAALREVALRWMTERAAAELGSGPGSGERVVVALTGAPGGERLVRRAARLAGERQGRLIGVHVASGDERDGGGDDLDHQREVLAQVGGTYREVVGDDVAAALAAFVDAEQATQLVLGSSRRSRWDTWRHGSLVERLDRHSVTADMHVVADDDPARRSAALPRIVRRSAVPPERERIGWVVALVGVPLLCWLLVVSGRQANLSTALLVNMALVIVVAAIGGLLPGLVASFLSVGLTNWFLTPPLHTLHINDRDDIVALIIFVATTVIVSAFVDRAARRARGRPGACRGPCVGAHQRGDRVGRRSPAGAVGTAARPVRREHGDDPRPHRRRLDDRQQRRRGRRGGFRRSARAVHWTPTASSSSSSSVAS